MRDAENAGPLRWAVVDHALEELNGARLEPDRDKLLRQPARLYHLQWAVGPTTFVLNDGHSWIGVDVHLYGRHGVASVDPGTACRDCSQLWQALAALAERALPSPSRDCRHETAKCVLRIDTPEDRGEHRLRLTVTFVHPNDPSADSAASTCCLTEFQRRLRSLGIAETAVVVDGG